MNDKTCSNADRELWREKEGDYYADSIHVTESGAIGINCGGTVVVKRLRDWFEDVERMQWLSDSRLINFGSIWDYMETHVEINGFPCDLREAIDSFRSRAAIAKAEGMAE